MAMGFSLFFVLSAHTGCRPEQNTSVHPDLQFGRAPRRHRSAGFVILQPSLLLASRLQLRLTGDKSLFGINSVRSAVTDFPPIYGCNSPFQAMSA